MEEKQVDIWSVSWLQRCHLVSGRWRNFLFKRRRHPVTIFTWNLRSDKRNGLQSQPNRWSSASSEEPPSGRFPAERNAAPAWLPGQNVTHVDDISGVMQSIGNF